MHWLGLAKEIFAMIFPQNTAIPPRGESGPGGGCAGLLLQGPGHSQ